MSVRRLVLHANVQTSQNRVFLSICDFTRLLTFIFMYSFIHSSFHSFIHSFTYPFIYSSIHSLIHSFTHPFIQSRILHKCWFIQNVDSFILKKRDAHFSHNLVLLIHCHSFTKRVKYSFFNRYLKIIHCMHGYYLGPCYIVSLGIGTNGRVFPRWRRTIK